MSNSRASGGIGIGGLLLILFITLKLAQIGDVADWSWWAVMAPLWGPVALVLAILAIWGIVRLVLYLVRR